VLFNRTPVWRKTSCLKVLGEDRFICVLKKKKKKEKKTPRKCPWGFQRSKKTLNFLKKMNFYCMGGFDNFDYVKPNCRSNQSNREDLPRKNRRHRLTLPRKNRRHRLTLPRKNRRHRLTLPRKSRHLKSHCRRLHL
jgi:hypothetical protein